MNRLLSGFVAAFSVVVLAGVAIAASSGEVAAREAVRMALLDLRLHPEPTDEDFEIADILFSIAQERLPADAELARRRVEAAYRRGDADALREATRALVRIDPGDTIATLRLISMRIGDLQTAERRLAAYQRYLDEGASVLDASVRSRLALDAALLAREQADNQRFTQLLIQASRLDPTNKEAAAVAAAVFAERFPGDPGGAMELSANLLLSDPHDPNVHFSIARQCAEQGLFNQAERFHAMARRLVEADAGRLPFGRNAERIVLTWHRRGPQAPIAELGESLAQGRYRAQQRIEALRERGLPTADELQPEDVRLALPLERIRVLAAMAAGDADELDRSLADASASVDTFLGELGSPGNRPAGLSEREAQSQTLELGRELLAMHYWAGRHDAEAIRRWSQTPLLRGDRPDEVLVAWRSALRGEDGAVDKLEELAEGDSRALGALSTLAIASGQRERALSSLRELVKADPYSPVSAWARSVAMSIADEDPARTEHTRDMERFVRSIPSWLDRMTESPSAFMSLEARFEGSRLDPLDPLRLVLRVRNIAPVPLGVGSGRPISGRFIVMPTIEIGTRGRQLRVLPEVFELDRRLRLRPRESVEVTVWADAGYTGWLGSIHLSEMQRIRARAVQGFRFMGGMPVAGSLALTSETDAISRRPLALARAEFSELIEAIAECTDETAPTVGAAVRARLLTDIEGLQLSEAERQNVAGALLRRINALGPDGLLAWAVMLPHGRMAPELAPLDNALRARLSGDDDPLLVAVAMVSRGATRDDRLLDPEREWNDPRLGRLAWLLRQRLGDEALPTLARVSRPRDLIGEYGTIGDQR